MNGPFLTERGIDQSYLSTLCCDERSSYPCACCCASCNRESAVPTASPDCDHLKSCLHHRRVGDQQGSLRLREREVEYRASANDPLYQKRYFRALYCPPDRLSPCSR